MANKRRRYTKLELLETSAVGIPAYGDAHYSLAKMLNKLFGHNTIERRSTKMSESNSEQPNAVKDEGAESAPEGKPLESQNSEENSNEESDENKDTPAESEDGESPENKGEEGKSEDEAEKHLVDLMTKSFETALENVTAKRGLVALKEENPVKDMSLGELAVKSGFFAPKH